MVQIPPEAKNYFYLTVPNERNQLPAALKGLIGLQVNADWLFLPFMINSVKKCVAECL